MGLLISTNGEEKTMTSEMIEKLEKAGFKRWTKGDKDRLYVNAKELGLELSYYKTGNVSSAWFCGDSISNSEGRRLQAAKTYIDLTSDTIISDEARLAQKVAEIVGVEPDNYWDKRIKF